MSMWEITHVRGSNSTQVRLLSKLNLCVTGNKKSSRLIIRVVELSQSRACPILRNSERIYWGDKLLITWAIGENCNRYYTKRSGDSHIYIRNNESSRPGKDGHPRIELGQSISWFSVLWNLATLCIYRAYYDIENNTDLLNLLKYAVKQLALEK